MLKTLKQKVMGLEETMSILGNTDLSKEVAEFKESVKYRAVTKAASGISGYGEYCGDCSSHY